jgi:hypothetical protein
VQYPIIIAVVLAAALYLWSWLCIRRAAGLLWKWAAQQGFELLRCDSVLGRPLWATALSVGGGSHRALDFSVTLRDDTGIERSGSARCGRFVGGAFVADRIEMTWSK